MIFPYYLYLLFIIITTLQSYGKVVRVSSFARFCCRNFGREVRGEQKNAVILHFKMIDCLSDTLFVVLLSIGFFYCFLFALILGVLISLCRFSLDSFFYRNRRRKLIYVNKTMPRIILGALSLAFLRNNHNFTSWL